MPRLNRKSPIASIEFDGYNLPALPAKLLLDEALGGTLTVNFSDGTSHDYYDVPLHVFIAFEAAGSKGQYFNANIRNHY